MTRTSVAAARRGTLLTVALLGLAVLHGTSAPPAHAEDTLSWSVAPADGEQGTGRPNFQYALEPGAVVHDGFEVTNQGAQPLTVGLYAADGFTTPEGQLDLLPAGEPSTDLGTWVTLESSEVTLQPVRRHGVDPLEAVQHEERIAVEQFRRLQPREPVAVLLHRRLVRAAGALLRPVREVR